MKQCSTCITRLSRTNLFAPNLMPLAVRLLHFARGDLANSVRSSEALTNQEVAIISPEQRTVRGSSSSSLAGHLQRNCAVQIRGTCTTLRGISWARSNQEVSTTRRTISLHFLVA